MMKTNSFFALACACAITGLAFQSCGPSAGPSDRESALAAPSKGAGGQARGPQGEVIVHLEKEVQDKMGLVIAGTVPHAMQPEFIAYGRVMSNSSAAFTVRAPIAGTLIAPAKPMAWPAIGAEFADDDVALGTIKPRLSAVERADIATRLATARGELEGSRAALTAAKAARERTRALNAENKNASDRALEEAEARVKSEEARSVAATASIETLQALLEPGAEAKASLPITLGQAGTVVEVLAHPGESVDAGAILLRLENFDHVLARVDMPLDGIDHVAAHSIRLAPVGNEERFVEAHRVGLTPTVDISNQGGSVLYTIEQASARSTGASPTPALRPGQAIVARIPESSAQQAGFLVPRSAVLRFAGKTWVYDATAEEEFTRREIDLAEPTEQGWFVTAPWAGAAHLVVTGAAAILSEEILGTQSKHGEEP